MSDPVPLEKPPEGHENENTINRRAAKLYQEYTTHVCSLDQYREAIVELVHQPLAAYIYHRMRYRGDYEDHEDIFQEALIRFLESSPNLNDRPLMGWLFTVTRNLLIDRWRRKKNRREISLEERTFPVGVCPHPAQTPEWLALQDAKKCLPWAYAFTFDMHIRYGYSQLEVAEMLGKPRSTIQHYIRTAKQRLSKSSHTKEWNVRRKRLDREKR